MTKSLIFFISENGSNIGFKKKVFEAAEGLLTSEEAGIDFHLLFWPHITYS